MCSAPEPPAAPALKLDADPDGNGEVALVRENNPKETLLDIDELFGKFGECAEESQAPHAAESRAESAPEGASGDGGARDANPDETEPLNARNPMQNTGHEAGADEKTVAEAKVPSMRMVQDAVCEPDLPRDGNEATETAVQTGNVILSDCRVSDARMAL